MGLAPSKKCRKESVSVRTTVSELWFVPRKLLRAKDALQLTKKRGDLIKRRVLIAGLPKGGLLRRSPIDHDSDSRSTLHWWNEALSLALHRWTPQRAATGEAIDLTAFCQSQNKKHMKGPPAMQMNKSVPSETWSQDNIQELLQRLITGSKAGSRWPPCFSISRRLAWTLIPAPSMEMVGD